MKFRLILTLWCLAGIAFALWDAHVTLAAPSRTIVKGVALLDWSHMEDLPALGATDFYGWGNFCAGRPHCLNMDRNWTLPAPACDDMLLLGNEPTNDEPAGHPIAASVAASVTRQIESDCPATRLIVANIHLDNGDGSDALDWLAAYFAAYGPGFHQTLGVHCYDPQPVVCENRIAAVEAMPAYTGPLWLTEFSVWGSVPDLQAFLDWINFERRVERAYIWTNRLSDPSFLNLVNDDGTLTAYGQAYHDWQGASWLAWLPVAGGQGYP